MIRSESSRRLSSTSSTQISSLPAQSSLNCERKSSLVLKVTFPPKISFSRFRKVVYCFYHQRAGKISGDFYVTCFAIGALISIPVALVGAPFWVQVVVWAICSMLSIWLVRPHLLKSLHKGGEDRRSNADALAGQIGEVTEMIPAGGYGRVKLDGDDWKHTSRNS